MNLTAHLPVSLLLVSISLSAAQRIPNAGQAKSAEAQVTAEQEIGSPNGSADTDMRPPSFLNIPPTGMPAFPIELARAFSGSGARGPLRGAVYRVGGGVGAPRVLYAPNPEYSEKARRARYQGIAVLWMIVGEDGLPRDIRVARSLGMGLDEEAIKAVQHWKFAPALKDGQPVAVQVNVEVTFRLTRR